MFQVRVPFYSFKVKASLQLRKSQSIYSTVCFPSPVETDFHLPNLDVRKSVSLLFLDIFFWDQFISNQKKMVAKIPDRRHLGSASDSDSGMDFYGFNNKRNGQAKFRDFLGSPGDFFFVTLGVVSSFRWSVGVGCWGVNELLASSCSLVKI